MLWQYISIYHGEIKVLVYSNFQLHGLYNFFHVHFKAFHIQLITYQYDHLASFAYPSCEVKRFVVFKLRMKGSIFSWIWFLYADDPYSWFSPSLVLPCFIPRVLYLFCLRQQNKSFFFLSLYDFPGNVYPFFHLGLLNSCWERSFTQVLVEHHISKLNVPIPYFLTIRSWSMIHSSCIYFIFRLG